MVDILASFGVVGVGRVDEERSITTINHAIVEEDTESGGGRGGIRHLFRGHNFLHDSFEIRACFCIVVKGEMTMRLRDGEHGDGGKH